LNVRKRKPSRRSVGAVRSEESEEAILDAAAGILHKEGFDALTVEAVARKARAGKPTIYRWWGTKTQLVFDAYTRSMPVIDRDLDLGDVRVELTRFFENLWRLWSSRNPASVSLGLLAEALSDPKLLSAYRCEYIPKRETPLVAILDRGVQRGDLPRDLDVGLMIEVLTGFHMMRLIKGKPVSPETGRQVLDLVLNSLGKSGKGK
jgi:AcrR family transcriptional regulator